MPKERLRQTLQELHAELSASPAVDDAARRQLEEVAADIDRVLHHGAPAPKAHVATLGEWATRFESDHPSLASAVRQVADALSRVGL